MRIRSFANVLGGGAAILAALGLIAAAGTSLTSATVPVVSMKPFMSAHFWQLDITWHAKDAYQDQNMNANLDMTATARFILEQKDRRDDWGRWYAAKPDSHDLALAGVLIIRNDHSRTDYKSAPGAPIDGSATLQVGGRTPGYQLDCSAAYPIKVLSPLLGTMDSMLSLLTSDIHAGRPVFCTGPLPTTGDTISGSMAFPAAVGPFVGSKPPFTRVGIQFVLKPFNDLAPLTPARKR